MRSNFVVLLDACVLYQSPVRDLILQLASKGLFQAKWTKRIEEEWVNSLHLNRPDLKKSQIEKICKNMSVSILDHLVEDYEDLLPLEILPDQNDAHVLKAAVKSHSQVIVTNNLKDFPSAVLDKYGIEAQHPDNFLRHLMDLDLASFLSCIKTIRERLVNPPKSAQDYLFTLHSFLPQTVNQLKPYIDNI